MEYTIKKLGNLAGISTRTLRYYDEIGILKPARINSSGYRIYAQAEVDVLQQILFYRELGVSLDKIKFIITSPDYDETNALKSHHKELLRKREQLNILISNVEKTIYCKEGRINMKDIEKFEGFKKNLIDDNEKKFGEEVREKFGEQAVNKSNDILKNITKEQYDEIEALSNSVLETLKKAYATGNPAGKLAQETADLHRQWLSFYWDGYNKDAHANLAQMYVDDERFTAYYDKIKSGATRFLRDAILIYTSKKEV
ncbi:MAG: MerR family transcriptional regulator [Sedimentibacter sp.]